VHKRLYHRFVFADFDLPLKYWSGWCVLRVPAAVMRREETRSKGSSILALESCLEASPSCFRPNVVVSASAMCIFSGGCKSESFEQALQLKRMPMRRT
jgi:hypothetical protein